MRNVSRVVRTTLAVVLACAAGASASAQDRTDLGFETTPIAESGWVVPTPGWTAALTSDFATVGTQSAKLELAPDSTATIGNLMRVLDAAPYRGKHILLNAKVRVAGAGRAQMWLRVDRPNGEMGDFDNMAKRPMWAGIGAWNRATIDVDVADDATGVAFGFLVFGSAKAFIDDVSIEVRGPAAPIQAPSDPRPLDERSRANVRAAAMLLSYVRFFHPSDQAVGVASWDHLAFDLIEQAEPATDAADLARRLKLAIVGVAPTVEIWAGGRDDGPPARPQPPEATSVRFWRHVGAGTIAPASGMGVYTSSVEREALEAGKSPTPLVKRLDGGVWCSLPYRVLGDDRGTLPRGATPAVLAKDGVRARLTTQNRSTRLAGVALAWGVFQHFFPYFAPDGQAVGAEWDGALTAALDKAAVDADASSFLDTLNELVAKLHDGHGAVMGRSGGPKSMLPFALEWAGDDLVVVGRAPQAPADVRLGDVVIAIDGRSIADCYANVSKWISGATEGWRRYSSTALIATRASSNDPMRVHLRRPDGADYEIDVDRIPLQQIAGGSATRPPNGNDVAPGVVYFNLDGTDAAALAAAMPKLEAAKGIIFDMRGYPNQAAYELIQHLIDEPAQSARWTIPIVTKPDREDWTWNESTRWNMPPLQPRLKCPVAFLTDGRAISYAESIMGIIEAYRLGAIVGSNTAGTNGNVNPFELPGGLTISWTGMRVLKHDGTRHHGVGIAPTVPVNPTAKGIAEGRDEVLEKAIEVVRAKIGAAGG